MTSVTVDQSSIFSKNKTEKDAYIARQTGLKVEWCEAQGHRQKYITDEILVLRYAVDKLTGGRQNRVEGRGAEAGQQE